jgi:putative ATP-binding cassette transporter
VDAAPLEVRTSVSTLELRDVTFTYPHEANDREFTLGPVSLRFSRGESVFVVGGNGSGKSTLAKVLCGLYHPTSGQILLDGTVVGDGNREWYREHFSVVFSEIFLFDRLAGIDPREVERRATTYLTRLGLNRVVSVQGGMFSTTALSHGQRKRLALLVAYLEDRPIYIFDEWAADQDPDFKRTFYMELIPELRAAGKTVIVNTHDAYHDVADRIVRLEEGRVVESVGSRDGVRVPEHMRPNGVLL